MGENAVAIAAIGLAATLAAAVIWLAKYLANKLSSAIEAHTKAAVDQAKSNEYVAKALVGRVDADQRMTDAFNEVASSNKEIAKETKLNRLESKRGNDQSEERNGHLGELILQGSTQSLEAIQRIKEQVIEHQTVKQSIVKKAVTKE